MSKTIDYDVTDGGGTLDANVLHDALLADATYVSWKGTWDATEEFWYDPLLIVEHNGTTISLTVPDATNETTLLTKVDAQRV